MSGDQDWDTVVLRPKNKPKADTKRPEQAAARAMQQGQGVEALRKQGTNKQRSGVPQNARKLDDIEEYDEISHASVARDVSLRIQQGRQGKGWTQKQLAQAINEKPTVVNDYEAGRGIPNQAILAKMERALGVKLRGKL
eukprot:m51a1_g11247 putative multiprotein bridging factor 1 (139) ;mRNA; r:30592-31308